jgi:dihydrofolate reductase
MDPKGSRQKLIKKHPPKKRRHAKGSMMSRVIVGTTMSLDGFINDRFGSVAKLYPNMEELHGTEMLQESIHSTGAVVMGRGAFDMAQGDFTGYEYQVPIFVLTHHPPAGRTKGQNNRLIITFVTDGIESAIEKARSAAGARDVTVVGGASTAQQCISAGLADVLEIGIVPILLGSGLRFFDNESIHDILLERERVQESSSRTDLRFRVLK